MNAAGLMACALLSLPTAALADDTSVELTLEGRPVDRVGGVAVLHAGRVFADAIDLTRCFGGLITLRRDGSAIITIGTNTGAFEPGSRRALINDRAVALSDPPFLRNGELFVPLEEFVSRIAAARVRVDARARRADIVPDASPR